MKVKFKKTDSINKKINYNDEITQEIDKVIKAYDERTKLNDKR